MALNFAEGQPNSHEAHLPQLVKSLVQVDTENTYVLLLRSDNQLCFPQSGPKVRHVVFPRLCRHKLFQILCEQIVVPIIVAALRVDVLHFTANVRPLLTPCRSVGTIHWVLTRVLTESFSWRKRVYFSLFERLSVAQANRLIAVSRSCRDDLVKKGVPEEKVEVIEHGISDRFKQGGVTSAFLNERGLRQGYLLYVGTSAPYKNLGALVEAYACARSTHGITEQLVLAGDIDRKVIAEIVDKCVKRLGDLTWSQHVICTGYVPYEKIPQLYAGAGVVLSLSLQETFGIVLLEAMASGIPLIVSAIPAYVEITQGAACVVEPENPSQVAAAIARLTGASDVREDLIRRGLARVEGFRWERAALATLRVYRAAAGGHLVSMG